MNIKIILEAKLKESFFKEGVFEYQKRLLGSVEVVEVSSIYETVKNKKNAYIITLELEGKELSSIEFASKIREIENDGFYNEILFLIGASDGLDKKTRELSNYKLCLSKMTFLHQEAVLILIEQIYRAYKILNNEPYHK